MAAVFRELKRLLHFGIQNGRHISEFEMAVRPTFGILNGCCISGFKMAAMFRDSKLLLYTFLETQ